MPGIASRGNSMSTTAPMHWTMVPDVWASAICFPGSTFQIQFPLPSPPHLEEGCPRSGRGGGGVPAQQAGWFCAPTTTPRLRRTPPPKGGGDCLYVSSYRGGPADDL